MSSFHWDYYRFVRPFLSQNFRDLAANRRGYSSTQQFAHESWRLVPPAFAENKRQRTEDKGQRTTGHMTEEGPEIAEKSGRRGDANPEHRAEIWHRTCDL